MTHRKELNIGYSDFKNIIENNNYFVDKTLLIKEVIKAQKAVLLLPRPRRFGKTLNLSMLRYFFDIKEAENSKLFANLAIWNTEDEIKEKQGKYPVIYLSFKDAKKDNWKSCYFHIRAELISLYSQHRYLLEGDTLYDNEKADFNSIINKTAEPEEYENSVKLLCEYLQRYHKQNVVILIDEYDTPIQAGYTSFYNEVVSFMRSLMSGAFKDNTNLYKGVITGILRVSKESIFTGLNNISVYSILENDFSDKFGFTETEVLKILKDFEVKTEYAEVEKWYNGYKFGETSKIYNPWSLLNFVVSKHEAMKTYWANTSANELIKNEIKNKESDTTREDILKLINNETIKKDVEENFVFPDLATRKNLLWTLLTYSGYLTTNKKISRKEYELKIPNYEIKTIFQDTIIEWFEGDIKVQKSLLVDTTKHLTNNNLTAFEQGFKQIIGDTFSYYDTAQNHEYVYQSYILGLLAIVGDDYIIKSNRESGEGRYDIMLMPHSKQDNGVVIEIKQIAKQAQTETTEKYTQRINTAIQEATSQIDRNKYCNELIAYGIPQTQIVKVPIVFAGKVPYVNTITQKTT